MCDGRRITRTKLIAFRVPLAADVPLPMYLRDSPIWSDDGSFVSLSDLGPADELLIQPTMAAGEWAVSNSRNAVTTDVPEFGEYHSPTDIIAAGVNLSTIPGPAIRVPLEGRDVANLYFWGRGIPVAGYLVSAVRYDQTLTISAERWDSGGGGTIRQGCEG